jgi:hypothetical protein
LQQKVSFYRGHIAYAWLGKEFLDITLSEEDIKALDSDEKAVHGLLNDDENKKKELL